MWAGARNAAEAVVLHHFLLAGAQASQPVAGPPLDHSGRFLDVPGVGWVTVVIALIISLPCCEEHFGKQ